MKKNYKESFAFEELIDFNEEMHLIDKRYQAENSLLKAIAIGNYAQTMNALNSYANLMRSPSQKSYPSSEDTLRDFKNSVHTMNTLFRKAVEENHVHPIYIHDYSSRFGYQIEHSTTSEELEEIIFQMLKKYCYLAKNYSLASYSKTVRDAILFININLCEPLSTVNVATAQNISPNYLSSQFKKEVGATISEYIRKKRIDMAIKLLNTTDLSIQEIASRVGIEDASYFSKQFKKQIGMSPAKYQKLVRYG